MKRLLILGLVILCSSVALGQSEQAPSSPTPSAEESAKEFVSLLNKKAFDKATVSFDESMNAALSSAKLEEVWNSQLLALGGFQEIKGTRTEVLGPYNVVFVTCQFGKQLLDIKVVFDQTNMIAGLLFLPTQEVRYQSPDYCKEGSFQETNVQVGQGKWVLPGTLTMPVGKGPFPAVILVHGSGPNDRDETIGPNKPFRDLACGLGSRGIAVLRYEKRTRQYANELASIADNLTVKEETVTDALVAISLLQKASGVDADRIFVLGHSLGGMLVPRIGKDNTQIAGFVVMAAPARPLEDLILEQTQYQLSLTGNESANIKGIVDELKIQIAAIKELSEQSSSKGHLLDYPKSYWLDLQGYKPAVAAKSLRQPMLVLQGEEDCQVNPTRDFGAWQQELSDRKDVAFKIYPNLNHLFMVIDGKSTGAEYQLPGNIAKIVVRDIADWIAKH